VELVPARGRHLVLFGFANRPSHYRTTAANSYIEKYC
jgi:hypothetical protein